MMKGIKDNEIKHKKSVSFLINEERRDSGTANTLLPQGLLEDLNDSDCFYTEEGKRGSRFSNGNTSCTEQKSSGNSLNYSFLEHNNIFDHNQNDFFPNNFSNHQFPMKRISQENVEVNNKNFPRYHANNSFLNQNPPDFYTRGNSFNIPKDCDLNNNNNLYNYNDGLHGNGQMNMNKMPYQNEGKIIYNYFFRSNNY
jgi:hypothetical protein